MQFISVKGFDSLIKIFISNCQHNQ